ncbi:tumor protein p63-regulated 1 protein isoform D [Alligator mississippiensis]|uniref:Tumor protein p63-regulated 1 protein isoform D n=1 Tax=Alligator mississippiensis TaxID=8496 RepID=A0A151MMH9_ALLMI|nr:tumor protein p63-regulated 1 protein isoform D [Alligator mississippiensis]
MAARRRGKTQDFSNIKESLWAVGGRQRYCKLPASEQCTVRATSIDSSVDSRLMEPGQTQGSSHTAHLEQAVDMLEEENNQEFETEELEEKHGGDVPEPRLATDVRDPSASATSASYPRPHVKQVIARKFFVTRPGAFDQAIEDINTHVVENAGETVDSFWLLTE